MKNNFNIPIIVEALVCFGLGLTCVILCAVLG